MNPLQTFEEFLATQSTYVGLGPFVLNMLLTTVLAILLAKLYRDYGSALSNRTIFSKNFPLIALATMFIITIVKSSLALSLGLVGALSIVRFRTAIKEPEELAYLFFLIAIGLGMGANQTVLTLVAFAFTVLIIWLINRFRKPQMNRNLSITVSSQSPDGVKIDDVADVLGTHCSAVALKRFDETPSGFEATFLVALERFEKLNRSREELRQLGENLRITYIDSGDFIA